jgi:exosortase
MTVEHKTSGDPAASAGTPLSTVARHTQVAVAGALLVAAFWPILRGMYGSWFDENAYMEHGILVIPAAAYMAWTKKAKLIQIPHAPSGWGVLLLLLGAMQATLGLAAQWIWVSRTAFLVSLVGSILAFYGFRMIRELAYPLCTLVLMITPPTFVYERLTLSLQLLASRLGETSLEGLGYSVVREGNILELVGAKLSVVEACSGIRSLISILFMCTLYSYFFVSGKWMRAVLLAMSIPIAILGNAGRIVATGVASQYNRQLIHGAAHDTLGYISVMLAAFGCILVHIALLYIQKTWRSRHA